MMEENDNQHHQLFLLKGQTIISTSEGNGKDNLFLFIILFISF
jgi:hypothetical protein